MKPLISVIIPVYNVEKYLVRCLDSIIDYDYKDYEIVIVNDGSPDNSQLIIDEYQKKNPHLITSFIKKNGGLSDARNFGLSKAKGKYILFVDSDDWLAPFSMKKLSNELNSSNLDILVFGHFHDYSNENLSIENKLNSAIYEDIDGIKEAIYNLDMIDLFNLAWNKVYKKEIIDKFSIKFSVDMEPGEDLLFNVNYFKYIKTMKFSSRILYHYMTQGEITLSSKYWSDKHHKCIEFNKGRKKLYNYYGMKEKKYLISYSNAYIKNISSAIINLYRNDCNMKRKERINVINLLISYKRTKEYLSLTNLKTYDVIISKYFIKYSNPFIIDLVFTGLMKIRNKKIYYHFRKKLLKKNQ